jgi:hypothetical protein
MRSRRRRQRRRQESEGAGARRATRGLVVVVVGAHDGKRRGRCWRMEMQPPNKHCTTRKRKCKCNPCSLLTHGYNALVPPGLVSRPASSKRKQQPGRRARAARVLRAKAAAAGGGVAIGFGAGGRRAVRERERSSAAPPRPIDEGCPPRAGVAPMLPAVGSRIRRHGRPELSASSAVHAPSVGRNGVAPRRALGRHQSSTTFRFVVFASLCFFLFFPVCRSLSPISLSSVSTVPRSPRANASFALGSRAASEPVRKTSASLARHRLCLQQSSTDSTRNGTFVTVLL